MQRQRDDNPPSPSQGGQHAPSRTNRRDLVGAPHQTDKDTQLSKGRGFVVESPPMTSTMAFRDCGHSIRGDLRNDFASGATECHTFKTECPSTLTGQAMARDDRARMTTRDPTKVKGVTSEIMTRDSGRQGYKIDPYVWMIMSRKDKKKFLWSNNVKFDLPPGESSQQPTNPGNPNHPDYNPYSRASFVRTSLKFGRGERTAAKQATSLGIQSATPVVTQPKVAGSRPAVSVPGQAHVDSSPSPTCLPRGAKKQLLDLLESIRDDKNHVSQSASASNRASVQANVAGTKSPITAPTKPTVSASNRADVDGTDSESAACAPTEPVACPTVDEIAPGDAAWDPRLFPGWVGYPDFSLSPEEYPCLFWSCAVKSATPAELVLHILLSHH